MVPAGRLLPAVFRRAATATREPFGTPSALGVHGKNAAAILAQPIHGKGASLLCSRRAQKTAAQAHRQIGKEKGKAMSRPESLSNLKQVTRAPQKSPKPRSGLTAAAVKFLTRSGPASTVRVAEAIRVSRQDASLILNRLQRLGRVRCVERGGRGRYTLPSVFDIA